MGKFAATLNELFGMDIRALAFMRIGLSAVIVLQCLDHFPHVKAFYSDEGILPSWIAMQDWKHWVLCVNLINGSWQFQMFLLALMAASALSLMVGFKTRLCTVVIWMLLCSFHSRNWLILGAEDKLLRILFFWFMFIPWGACYSLDNAGSRRHPVPLRVFSLGTTAYLLQIAFFYLFAGLLKYAPSWTVNGTAVYTVLSAKQFVKPFGESLLQFPKLLTWLTAAALALERYVSVFLFFPFKTVPVRLAAIAALALFHAGILICMELKYFQWISLITLVGFLPTPFLNTFLRVPAYATAGNQTSALVIRRKFDLFQMPPYLNALIASLIIYVLFWNICDLRRTIEHRRKTSYIMHPRLDWVAYALGLRQHWGMYGPAPFTDDGWFVLPGQLRNGKTVDIFRSGEPVVWEEPLSVIDLNGHYSWTLYYMNVHAKRSIKYVRPWGEYVCREWNRTHPEELQLVKLSIVFMERSLYPYRKPSVRKVPLLELTCNP